MNYKIYHDNHEFLYTFNFITTVGDLQTIILQTLNIPKKKLLYILYQGKTLGTDYPFDNILIDKDLYDITLLIIVDHFEIETGTKQLYATWLRSKLLHNDIMEANQQLLYFNTHNDQNTTNLDFFTTPQTRSDLQSRNTNRTPLSRLFSSPPSTHHSHITNENNHPNRSTTEQREQRTRRSTRNRNRRSEVSDESTLQQMVQDFFVNTNGTNMNSTNSFLSSGNLSNIFNEMINQNIYDLGVTVTQGPNGNSVGLMATGNILDGSNSDFFNMLLNNLQPVPVTLSRDNINRLPQFKFEDLPREIRSNNNCSICLENFNNTDPVRVLLCKHYFHVSCIDHWLTRENVRCPLCRHDNRNEHHITHTEGDSDMESADD